MVLVWMEDRNQLSAQLYSATHNIPVPCIVESQLEVRVSHWGGPIAFVANEAVAE